MPNDDDKEQLQDDLDATSESLESDARRVARIEEEKRGLERGDPRNAHNRRRRVTTHQFECELERPFAVSHLANDGQRGQRERIESQNVLSILGLAV